MHDSRPKAKIGKTILQDLRPGSLLGRIKKEWRALKHFYLDQERRQGPPSMINAGHMPPLIASPDGLKELAKGDPAIRLKSSTVFHEHTIHLKNNEVLLIYSDGLNEARNEDNIFWGEQPIKEILQKHVHRPTAEIGNALLVAFEKFTGDAPLFDDISLLLIWKK